MRQGTLLLLARPSAGGARGILFQKRTIVFSNPGVNRQTRSKAQVVHYYPGLPEIIEETYHGTLAKEKNIFTRLQKNYINIGVLVKRG